MVKLEFHLRCVEYVLKFFFKECWRGKVVLKNNLNFGTESHQKTDHKPVRSSAKWKTILFIDAVRASFEIKTGFGFALSEFLHRMVRTRCQIRTLCF